LVVQQAEAGTDQVVKVGLKLVQELGDRTKKLEEERDLYRNMAIKLATREGVEVPDFVKDDSGGLGEEQAGQLREWLEQLAAGEETTTTTTMTRGRTPSRKRGKYATSGTSRGGISRGKRSGRDDGDDGAVAQ
jgi:hypothetical protein